MGDKVYCEDCISSRCTSTVCDMAVHSSTNFMCVHKNNVIYKDSWMRKLPREITYKHSPGFRNSNNDCRDFKMRTIHESM